MTKDSEAADPRLDSPRRYKCDECEHEFTPAADGPIFCMPCYNRWLYNQFHCTIISGGSMVDAQRAIVERELEYWKGRCMASAKVCEGILGLFDDLQETP